MNYNGLLDEWLYAARILTEAEVAERYNNGFGSTATGGTGNAFTPPTPSTPAVSVPSGSTANRPVIGGVAGQLYFNTDTQTLEHWDGTDWLPAAPGLDEVILQSLIDAKGDLIAGSADDTPVRLAVGADGELLTADSSAPEGVSWQPLTVPSVGQYRALVYSSPDGIHFDLIDDGMGHPVTVLADLE